MSNELYKSPPQIAFKKMQERISKDQNLDADIVAAMITDISSNNPNHLESIKKTLLERREESSDDSDKNAQSK
ncbi:MAG: hypothetical protein DDT31_01958 [Syntrophomonadaceae bacterium]|nr:hypothetical protein [Bacillota bacterium]